MHAFHGALQVRYKEERRSALWALVYLNDQWQ